MTDRDREKRDEAEKAFESFHWILTAHIRVVGGLGDPDRIRKQTVEELYKELYPNDIKLTFINERMEPLYKRVDTY